MTTPEIRSSSKPLEMPSLLRALDAGLDAAPATEGRGFYQGVDVPDVRVARAWKPGDRTTSGTTANRQITATYAALDRGMKAWLGEPMVPNWATFGKFASRTAGNQIIRLEALMRTDSRLDFGSTVALLTDALRNPRQNLRLAKALTGGKLSPALLARNARLLRDALVHGNTAIIADIAPAYDVFLRAESAGKNGLAALRAAGFGRAPRDPQAFIFQAFEAYTEAQALAQEIAAFPPAMLRALEAGEIRSMPRQELDMRDRLATLMERRAQLVLRGNLLLGFQEQMFSLQVPEVFENPAIRKLMVRAGRELAMEDPRGRMPLLQDVEEGSWADFETRMGLTEVPLDTQIQADSSDILIPFRGPDGRERLYLTTGQCKPGNITNYMYRATLEYAPNRRKLLQDPGQLDRAYTDPWNERIARFLGGLKRRILG